jgi:hypothetical protein
MGSACAIDAIAYKRPHENDSWSTLLSLPWFAF